MTNSIHENEFFSGTKLYGDDFTLAEVEAWYTDEKEGYAGLVSSENHGYQYGYHALNVLHGFARLPARDYSHALGFGSAYAYEFKPIAKRIANLTVIEPSDSFVTPEVYGIPANYIKPNIDGTLPFADETFDLITCLGVLHHIPNVSFVLSELYRCLQSGGQILLREPVVSMGDWRQPRYRLTKHERGIPLPIFQKVIQKIGFHVVSERLCMFPLTPKLGRLAKTFAYNHPFFTRSDAILCQLLTWNLRYHAVTPVQKIRPTNVFYVLEKP